MISMARSMTNFVGSRLLSLFSLRATKNVSTRQDAIFENFTSKRDSRCCIYRFLTLVCQPKALWNRQSTRLSPTRKQGTISPFIVLQALGARDCLQPTWQSGTWVSLVMRLSSGFDNISPVLPKHLSNNGWYSMAMSLNRNGRFLSVLCGRNPHLYQHKTTEVIYTGHIQDNVRRCWPT